MNNLGPPPRIEEPDFLSRLEEELREVLSGPEDTLQLAARHLLLQPRAKRARPRLCLRLGRLAGAWLSVAGGQAGLLDIAVAAELLHNASLLHDDVVDAGDERRGLPTASRLYGNGVAVLAGDLLITLALDRLRSLPREVTTCGIETVAAMARAALLELDARGSATLDLASWRRVARGKTGALLGFCGRAVGYAAGDPGLASRLGEIAERLGVAFQMADDLADYEAGTGKATLKDLQERTPGLPLVLAYEGDAGLRDDVARSFAASPDGLDAATARRFAVRIERAGAFRAARALLREEAQAATRLLSDEASADEVQDVLRFASELIEPGYFITEGRAA